MCRQDSTIDGRTTFTTSVVMGKREEALDVAARQLLEALGALGHTK